jgi:hypothetical protein
VDPDVRKFVHPILASDFRVSETYQRVSSEPLPCPVFFSGGTDDPRIRKENVEAWRKTVEKPEMCSIRWFNGGHNYLFNAKESKTEFLEYLTAQMSVCLETRATEKGPVPELHGTCNLENGVVKPSSSLPSSEPEPSELHERSAPLGHPTPDCGASIQSGSDAGATVGSNSSYAIPSGTKVSTYSPPTLARINVENDVETENTQDSEIDRSGKSVERKSFFRWLCGHG